MKPTDGIHQGDVITLDTRRAFLEPGDLFQVFSFRGDPKCVRQVTRLVSWNQFEIRLPSIWRRIWFYLRHPSWWKFALDIPFRPNPECQL